MVGAPLRPVVLAIAHARSLPSHAAAGLFHRNGRRGLGSDHAYLRKFSYDPYVPEYRLRDFVQAFLQDPGVQQTLQVLQPNDTWRPLGPIDTASLRFRPLRTTAVDMTLFDPLFTTGIVRPNGAITKCFDEYVSPDTITPIDDAETAETWTDPGDFVVSDELQRVLVDPTSERYAAFPTSARQELLFALLEHMVLGGRVNQFEDELAPYLHAARTLYKDFVSPCKLLDGTLAVQGMAVQVVQHESRAGGAALYPMRHRQNFMLVVVDPVRRHVAVWYHASPNYYQ
ncbi:hypothetical protein GGF32_004398 [Allomyces javanicus]|nr:hypothetical protein GGF32_004398 [Allomyces javanicus]